MTTRFLSRHPAMKTPGSHDSRRGVDFTFVNTPGIHDSRRGVSTSRLWTHRGVTTPAVECRLHVCEHTGESRLPPWCRLHVCEHTGESWNPVFFSADPLCANEYEKSFFTNSQKPNDFSTYLLGPEEVGWWKINVDDKSRDIVLLALPLFVSITCFLSQFTTQYS